MQFASMHLESQNTLQPLDGSIVHQCTSNHKIQPLMAPTLRMHSTNSNQVLYESNVHKYTLMIQIKTYNAGMCTHAHPMLRNTSKEHKSSTCAPPNSKWPPKPQSSSKALQNSSKAPKALPTVQTCTSNTHKPSISLSMHTSNQTFNHATRMSGPITY
jgi:hypothetical protein